MTRGIFLFLVCSGVFLSVANGQVVTSDRIKPGKERIEVDLPKEERWRRTRIAKDEASIRAWRYHPTRGDTASMAVRFFESTTIDRRFYPIKAQGAMVDRFRFVQRTFPNAQLDILHDKHEGNRYSVIFSIHPGEDAQEVLLMMAAEGPTAFHSVEVQIPIDAVDEDVLQVWSSRLANSQLR